MNLLTLQRVNNRTLCLKPTTVFFLHFFPFRDILIDVSYISQSINVSRFIPVIKITHLKPESFDSPIKTCMQKLKGYNIDVNWMLWVKFKRNSRRYTPVRWKSLCLSQSLQSQLPESHLRQAQLHQPVTLESVTSGRFNVPSSGRLEADLYPRRMMHGRRIVNQNSLSRASIEFLNSSRLGLLELLFNTHYRCRIGMDSRTFWR